LFELAVDDTRINVVERGAEGPAARGEAGAWERVGCAAVAAGRFPETGRRIALIFDKMDNRSPSPFDADATSLRRGSLGFDTPSGGVGSPGAIPRQLALP
jgi:hypothetical protein